jgi:hypothetical protein
VELTESGFGANDFVIGALMELGLWDQMIRMYPNRLKEPEKGYDWRILNGVAVLRELMKIETIVGTDKVLSDPRLVAAAGFNLQEVSEKLEQGKPVIDSETLANHLARIDLESTYYTTLEFVRFLRTKRWVRGKVFAADGDWITVPYGRNWDGMGSVGDGHGYKLVSLFNVHQDRELFTGFLMGPLNRSEPDMLLELFRRYEQQVGPIRELIDTLLLDRGFWGAGFFKTLIGEFHIQFVTRPRDWNLAIVRDLMALVEADRKLPKSKRELRWQWRTEKRPPNKNYPRGEVRTLLLVGIDGLRVEDPDGEALDLNAAVVYEHDENRRPLVDPDDPTRQLTSIYITPRPCARNPMAIRKLYRQRWPIENQGFRNANQAQHIDHLTRRVSFDAIVAGMAFKLMVYDCEKILRVKYPKHWAEEKKRLRNLGRKEYIGGPAVLVYTEDGHMGIFKARRIRDLVAEATRRHERQRLKEQLLNAQREGRSVADIIDQLDDN